MELWTALQWAVEFHSGFVAELRGFQWLCSGSLQRLRWRWNFTVALWWSFAVPETETEAETEIGTMIKAGTETVTRPGAVK